MNTPANNVIETRGLSKQYKNIQALKTLDLKVRQNSIFGFLGAPERAVRRNKYTVFYETDEPERTDSRISSGPGVSEKHLTYDYADRDNVP